jgi:hypothetical protein
MNGSWYCKCMIKEMSVQCENIVGFTLLSW